MNYEKFKLLLAFDGLLKSLTPEQESYLAGEMKAYFTNEELRKIGSLMEDCEVDSEEILKSFIEDFKSVLFK